MNTPASFSEVVEAEGHLIDSQILNVVFDTVVKHNASFDVLKFDIGRSNDEPSSIAMRISAETEAGLEDVLEELVALGCRLADSQDAITRVAERDGCVPDDFYSTTNHRTLVRIDGQWIEVEQQRMDAVIVIEQGAAICRKLRDVRTGDAVICGVNGIRVIPEFQERDRHGFAFMTNEISSERRVEVGVARIASMMQEMKAAGGRIAVVAGPVVVHTGGGAYFQELIRSGFVDVLLAGQRARGSRRRAGALRHVARRRPEHRASAIEGGHRHHMRAINTICRAGGLRQAVEQGVLTSGVMYECIRHDVDFVLAGSIRDDGPLPDTIMDLRVAQDRYATALENVRLVLALSTMLHGIGVGNMLPSWVQDGLRGHQSGGGDQARRSRLVADHRHRHRCRLFLHRLAQRLKS